jgi:hypothetical protein
MVQQYLDDLSENAVWLVIVAIIPVSAVYAFFEWHARDLAARAGGQAVDAFTAVRNLCYVAIEWVALRWRRLRGRS